MASIVALITLGSPEEPPIASVGNMLIALHEPSDATQVTILLGPNLADYRAAPAPNVRHAMLMTDGPDTQELTLVIAGGAARRIRFAGAPYSIRLMRVLPIANSTSPAYELFITEEDFEESLQGMTAEDSAKTRLQYGQALDSLDRREEALRQYEIVVTEHSNPTNAKLRVLSAIGYLERAYLLASLRRPALALESVDRLIERYAGENDDTLKRLVVYALAFKARLLYSGGDAAEAIQVWSAIAQNYEGRPEPETKAHVADSLINIGNAYLSQGRWREASEAFERTVGLFGVEQHHTFRRRVAQALLNKGYALWKNGDPAGAKKAWIEVGVRFTKDADSVVLEQVAMANTNLAKF